MGMFDTIHFSKPIYCSYCGEKHTSTQTKRLLKAMQTIRINDLTYYKGSGVFPDKLLCHDQKKCNKIRETYNALWGPDIYIVIKDGVYVGTFPNEEIAMKTVNDRRVPRMKNIQSSIEFDRELLVAQDFSWVPIENFRVYSPANPGKEFLISQNDYNLKYAFKRYTLDRI